MNWNPKSYHYLTSSNTRNWYTAFVRGSFIVAQMTDGLKQRHTFDTEYIHQKISYLVGLLLSSNSCLCKMKVNLPWLLEEMQHAHD